MNRKEIFKKITSSEKQDVNPQLILDFASSFDWKPSYYLKSNCDFANYHIVVEHGLHNTAILTFLNKQYDELNYQEIRELVNLSYNSIIEWNIPISSSQIYYLYSRNYEKKEVGQFEIKTEINFNEVLSSTHFEKIKEKKPHSNIRYLDDILIETIQNWQSILKSKLPAIKQDALSNFINTLILFRAIEDKRKKAISSERILLKILNENLFTQKKISEILKIAFEYFQIDISTKKQINYNNLSLLDTISLNEFLPLIKEFYINKDKDKYYYDFSIISKNALSRIYEKYVTILKTSEVEDLFGPRIITNSEKSPGLAYTPEYIARFFAKYVIKNYPLINTQPVKIAEPAIGSGIFLRSILELVEEHTEDIFTSKYFDNIFGNDIDNNAVNAAKLSLSLLYLSIFDVFPDDLNIINQEAIGYLGINKGLHNSFDIVVSNPPFIRVEEQHNEIKEKIKEYLVDLRKGRVDTYIAFVKMGIDLLKSGGLGLFVLPSSFLTNVAGLKIRKELYDNCNIRLICDLSPIQVFENKNVYVILLVFEKGKTHDKKPLIMKSRAKVGEALESVLSDNENINSNYEVFNVENNNFEKDYWYLLNKEDQILKNKIEKHNKLVEFAKVRQGIVTGDDSIFIVDLVPSGEKEVYIPLIPDRNISNFDYSKRKLSYVIYPIKNGVELTEDELKRKFPKTYNHLKLRQNKVGKWWIPHRTRKESIFNPKIITPYLSITPKFALDKTGDFLITRSPFIYLNDGSPTDLLYYLLGILNSSICYWYLGLLSNKYKQNYNKVEVGHLEQLRIPSPMLDSKLTSKITELTKKIIKLKGIDKIQSMAKMEEYVNDLYDTKPNYEMIID